MIGSKYLNLKLFSDKKNGGMNNNVSGKNETGDGNSHMNELNSMQNINNRNSGMSTNVGNDIRNNIEHEHEQHNGNSSEHYNSGIHTERKNKIYRDKRIIHEGWLNKWTNIIGSYRPRYFVLENGILRYAIDKYSPTKETFVLSHCKIRVCPDDPLHFEIETIEQGILYLKADLPEQKHKWYISFKKAQFNYLHGSVRRSYIHTSNFQDISKKSSFLNNTNRSEDTYEAVQETTEMIPVGGREQTNIVSSEIEKCENEMILMDQTKIEKNLKEIDGNFTDHSEIGFKSTDIKKMNLDEVFISSTDFEEKNPTLCLMENIVSLKEVTREIIKNSDYMNAKHFLNSRPIIEQEEPHMNDPRILLMKLTNSIEGIQTVIEKYIQCSEMLLKEENLQTKYINKSLKMLAKENYFLEQTQQNEILGEMNMNSVSSKLENMKIYESDQESEDLFFDCDESFDTKRVEAIFSSRLISENSIDNINSNDYGSNKEIRENRKVKEETSVHKSFITHENELYETLSSTVAHAKTRNIRKDEMFPHEKESSQEKKSTPRHKPKKESIVMNEQETVSTKHREMNHKRERKKDEDKKEKDKQKDINYKERKEGKEGRKDRKGKYQHYDTNKYELKDNTNNDIHVSYDISDSKETINNNIDNVTIQYYNENSLTHIIESETQNKNKDSFDIKEENNKTDEECIEYDICTLCNDTNVKSINCNTINVYTDKNIKRRSKLPSPRTELKISLWSLLKDCIGKDLSRICMPIYLNEPSSFLQRLAEDFQYVYLLEYAAKQKHSCSRLAFVTAFTISPYASVIGRTFKPFNPLLGETYELTHRKFRFVAEQVLHHPPVTAYHCQNEYMENFASIIVNVQILGKSIQVTIPGSNHLILKVPLDTQEQSSDTNNKDTTNKNYSQGKNTKKQNDKNRNSNYRKEHYTYQRTSMVIHNIIFGKLWVELQGNIIIRNHNNGDFSVVRYIRKGWFDKDIHKVRAIVCDRFKNVHFFIHGKWSEEIYIAYVKNLKRMNYSSYFFNEDGTENTGHYNRNSVNDFINNFDWQFYENQIENLKSVCVWKAQQRPMNSDQYYGFNFMTMELNEITPEYDKTKGASIACTDSRFRPDQRNYENGNIEVAMSEKQRLENKQRQKSKMQDTTYKPRWFYKDKDPIYRDNEMYMFNHKYWTAKENNEFPNTPDIF